MEWLYPAFFFSSLGSGFHSPAPPPPPSSFHIHLRLLLVTHSPALFPHAHRLNHSYPSENKPVSTPLQIPFINHIAHPMNMPILRTHHSVDKKVKNETNNQVRSNTTSCPKTSYSSSSSSSPDKDRAPSQCIPSPFEKQCVGCISKCPLCQRFKTKCCTHQADFQWS